MAFGSLGVTDVVGPYLMKGLMHVFFRTKFPIGPIDPGPTWFLNILMIFSIVYAFACGKNWSPKVECPTLLGFFGIAIATGIMTSIMLLFTSADDPFLGVPFFGRDFPTFPVYFWAG